MSKPYEMNVLSSDNVSGRVITAPIRSSKKNKIASCVIPNAFAGFGVALGVIISTATGTYGPLVDVLAAMGALGVGGSAILLYIDKLEAIADSFHTKNDNNKSLGFKTRRAARKDRVHINSFSIRENVNTEIKVWQDPKNAVPSGEATHTVNQYLRKTKKGFMVEQEVVPNPEIIWGISADALVEVYNIQENKTKELSQ